MFFQRFEVEGLSHYSYAVGCPAARELAIVDPERNVDRYVEFAARKKMRITAVLETHIHADYASGARELAERTGAVVRVSGYDEGELYEVAFRHEDLAEGDRIDVGNVRLVALHTPGHTPEHLSFLVYELSRSADVPELMLSGDFLFVGSLGRPDLLGEDAKQALARRLYASTRGKLAGLPDGLEIHPAHGAGSMCGAGMSARPSSTLGYERAANPYLDPGLTEAQFVEKILGSAPPFPPYYRRMKKLNAEGPALLGETPGGLALPLETFQVLATPEDAVVVDLRDHLGWCGGHLPDSLSVGDAPSFAVWAAWVVPYGKTILLVTDGEEQAGRAARALVRVGLDDVAGYLAGGIAAWRAAGLPMRQTEVMTVHELHERLRGGAAIDVLDVRTDAEWSAGHIDGAMHLHGGQVGERLAEVPAGDTPTAVICGGGYRSTVVASVLERADFEGIVNVTGGMGAWRAAGLPVTRGGVGVSP